MLLGLIQMPLHNAQAMGNPKNKMATKKLEIENPILWFR